MKNVILFCLIIQILTNCKSQNGIMKKYDSKHDYSVDSKAIKKMLNEMKWEKLYYLNINEFFDIYLLENKNVLVVTKFEHSGVIYADIDEFKRIVFNSENTTSINKKVYPFTVKAIESFDEIKDRISKKLLIKLNKLDGTIGSLEILDKKINKIDIQKRVEQPLYNDLIWYCLNVLNNEVKGEIRVVLLEGERDVYIPQIVTINNLIYTPVGDIYDELISSQYISLSNIIDAQIYKYKF